MMFPSKIIKQSSSRLELSMVVLKSAFAACTGKHIQIWVEIDKIDTIHIIDKIDNIDKIQ